MLNVIVLTQQIYTSINKWNVTNYQFLTFAFVLAFVLVCVFISIEMLDSGFWILDSEFWILDSEYILALALKREILNALMLYCQSLNTLALNSYSQDALVLNINCSNLNSTYRVSHNAKNPGIRDTNIWTEGVEFHTQDLGSNLSQLQSSPSTYESVYAIWR